MPSILGHILVGAVLIVIVALDIRYLLSGRSGCSGSCADCGGGCGGNCSGCSHACGQHAHDASGSAVQ